MMHSLTSRVTCRYSPQPTVFPTPVAVTSVGRHSCQNPERWSSAIIFIHRGFVVPVQTVRVRRRSVTEMGVIEQDRGSDWSMASGLLPQAPFISSIALLLDFSKLHDLFE